MALSYSIVVPTLGRASLKRLVESVDRALADAPVLPNRIVLVHDAAPDHLPTPRLDLGRPSDRLASRVTVISGGGRGPAAARNAGWRAAAAPPRPDWIAFLDDDVQVTPGWGAGLVGDLDGLAERVGGSQGRLHVPLPPDRPATDWERNVAGLEQAAWATADMAYRRVALEAVGGFDPRFTHAYREDADLALRMKGAGWELVRGQRQVDHPVRPADRWVSVRLQRGNGDDVLMRALHGRDWRERASAPPGRRGRHLAVTAAGATAVAALVVRRPRLAALSGLAWLAGTAELAAARIAPGPRTPDEIATMVATSAAIPPVATGWFLVGLVRWRKLLLRPAARPGREDGGSSVSGDPPSSRA